MKKFVLSLVVFSILFIPSISSAELVKVDCNNRVKILAPFGEDRPVFTFLKKTTKKTVDGLKKVGEKTLDLIRQLPLVRNERRVVRHRLLHRRFHRRHHK